VLSILRRARNTVDNQRTEDLAAAASRAQAIIWFGVDGTILDANGNFLNTTGYALDEIVGRHHRIFMPPQEAESADYRQFWEALRAGRLVADTVKRRAKDGRIIWLEASYNPLTDTQGAVVGFVKLAIEVTVRVNAAFEAQDVWTAIDRSQLVMEFDPSGIILNANRNFLDTTGYGLHELKGKHHSMLLSNREAETAEYRSFWQDLGAGGFRNGEYCLRSRTGDQVWVQATYNGIRGHDGKVAKVIKFATNITHSKLGGLELAGKVAALDRSQAIIEFDLSGKILTANQNFLTTMGYTLSEVVGKHHRIFMPGNEASTAAYADFWSELSVGKIHQAEYRRKGKGGRDIWILASYNPIFDADGKVRKVVKFATDVTGRKESIRVIGRALEALATGDLTHRISATLDAELDQLKVDLNNAVDRLAATMTSITDSARSVVSECAGIASSAAKLSTRTEKQAHTLAATSNTLVQIAKATSEGTEQTVKAGAVAASAKASADTTSAVVMNAVEAMTKIADSSAQISRIISVIDEIAFQTNLLALNAGVEAARAGDAGRGFAVVASEVRALALRSSTAAKEIEMLIGQSVNEVKNGESLVNAAGTAISDIRTMITDIHDRMIVITESAADQNHQLTEMSRSVGELDQVTQNNVAMSEETAAATSEMTRAANHLFDSISDFKLDASDAARSRSRFAS
jgi:methyl-accepting chemotaxis protein